MAAIKRNNFTPTATSKVCSDHFIESDYLVRPGTYIRRLKAESVPTVFLNFPSHLQKKISVVKEDRKSPTECDVPIIVKYKNIELSLIESPVITSPIIIGPCVSAATQTENTVIIRSPTKAFLRRNIKSLRQKLRRKDKKINNLIQMLKKENLLNREKSALLTD